jgi:hypothetical protein
MQTLADDEHVARGVPHDAVGNRPHEEPLDGIPSLAADNDQVDAAGLGGVDDLGRGVADGGDRLALDSGIGQDAESLIELSPVLGGVARRIGVGGRPRALHECGCDADHADRIFRGQPFRVAKPPPGLVGAVVGEQDLGYGSLPSSFASTTSASSARSATYARTWRSGRRRRIASV